MLPAQRAWWQLENFVRLMVGGVGSGKTYIGALRSLFLSSINSPIPGMYVSASYKQAKKTIIPTLHEILRRAQVDYTFKVTDNEFIIHSWQGTIWIGSGEDPDSLKGPNLAWAGIDEPFIQKREVFDEMMFRVRVDAAVQREIFLTGTPEELNWGYDLAMNDKGLLDVGLVYASTRDNFHNASDFVTNIERAYDEDMQAAYLEGKFVNLTSGRVYKPFDRKIHLAERPTGLENLPIVAGIDFNVDYMSAEIAYQGPTWLHFFDEIRLSNSNTFELSAALKEKYPRINVYPDPTGSARKSSSSRSEHRILEDDGFKVYSKAQVGVRDRVNSVNKMLRDKNLSFENCPYWIGDLERNTWRSGDIDKRDLSMTHAGDGAGYMIEYLFPVRGGKVEMVDRWTPQSGNTQYQSLRQGLLRSRQSRRERAPLSRS